MCWFYGCKEVKGGWHQPDGKWLYVCVSCGKKHYLSN